MIVVNAATLPLMFVSMRRWSCNLDSSNSLGNMTRNDMFDTSYKSVSILGWWWFIASRFVRGGCVTERSSLQLRSSYKQMRNLFRYTVVCIYVMHAIEQWQHRCACDERQIPTTLQSCGFTHPTMRTFTCISSPLFMPWNMTARKPNRYPSGGSNTGGIEHIDCIIGLIHPSDLTSIAEFKTSPFPPTRCNVTSDKRLWFQPATTVNVFLEM